MKIILFFDLPSKTREEKKETLKFRKLLLKNGFKMLQFSVYVRSTKNETNAITHINRIKLQLPKEGNIRVMVVTKKQYEEIEILLGEKKDFESYDEEIIYL